VPFPLKNPILNKFPIYKLYYTVGRVCGNMLMRFRTWEDFARKKKISILVIVTIILLVLVGCSNKTVNTTEPKNNDAQVQDTTVKLPYVHDDLLVNADWLKDNLNENTIIIDVRDEKTYNAGHITGAIHAQNT
jgi:hypothetical protein